MICILVIYIKQDGGRAGAIHSHVTRGCGGVISWARATRPKLSKSWSFY